MRISKEVMLFKPKATELDIEDAGTKATKHITTIGDDGIRVHDAYHNTTNFVQIDSEGLEVYKGGESVGLFGAIARIGRLLKARFLINADSLEAYDDNDNKYFEVSADGIYWGSSAAASQAYADSKASAAQSAAISAASSDATSKANAAQANAISTASADATAKADEAAKTATNFITTDSTGIKVHNTDDSTNYTHIGSDDMSIYLGGTRYARFGAWCHLGAQSGLHLKAESSGLMFAGSNGRSVFDVHLSGATETRYIEEYFGSRSCALAGEPVSGSTMKVMCIGSADSGWTVFEFTAGTSGTKTYSKGSANYTVTYTASTQTLTISGTPSPRIRWVRYSTEFPNMYTTLGIRSFGEDEESSGLAGQFSLTQGIGCRGAGLASTALNYYTAADGDYQTAVGRYNAPDETSLFLVGNGTQNYRSNAMQVDEHGNIRAHGNVYANCSNDSSNGTMLGVLKLTTTSVSSLPKTLANSSITANMEVINCVLSNPSAQTGDWTVTTSAGSLTIAGSISGTTDITLYLAEPST